MAEKWRLINGHQFYSISDKGQVRNETTGRILKPYPNKEGRLQVRLRNNRGFVDHFVHRLVAEHFLPNFDPECQVSHSSSDYTDNRVENLSSTLRLASPRTRGYRLGR